jgi:arylsulfate sulfotransferase
MAVTLPSGYRPRMWIWLWAGCQSTDGEEVGSPKITEGPSLTASSEEVRLVRLLTVSTDQATTATVLLDMDGERREITFPDRATTHVLPLLGLLADTPITATVTLTAEDGDTVTADPVAFTVSDLFVPAPDVTLLVSDRSRAEPGYTLIPSDAPDTGITVLQAVDLDGRVVWQYRPSLAGAIASAQSHADGTVSALIGGRFARRFDFADRSHVSWSPTEDVLADEIPVDVPGFHHEVAFEPDGSFWTLHKKNVRVDDYPLDSDDLTVRGPATLDADMVVHIAPDGVVLGSWLLTDYLDPQRIGFDATDEVAGGDLAWSHANAIAPLGDADQTFLVSVRHQDVVVKIRGSTNEAVWILGNHDGWAPGYEPLLLEPEEPLLWFIHQHAPAIDAQGEIVLFDNGNYGHANPYMQSPPGIDESRVVRYAVDEVAHTVRETFAFVADADVDPLFSQALGNADPLPTTGNLLATFSYVKRELGIPNVDLGLGEQSIRVIEVAPDDGTVVWDLRMNGSYEVSPLGWQSDRAIRVPSLYPPDVVVRVVE